ncbi:DUF2004 domain-containing protein [Pinibacter aurantiacus]|uniref:DUF2004 domain-containing protein n=1 Tax=Pinibacter aurantiacus TaxID=2851599 RepID=A0A9E2W9M2_9BACT|nr:DUF2004 domain-containing protein [Pinibacter aurantiacus]MBV4360286.1 DUF2004 domain-containing protein [Pinibacter aurantiacus]
MASYPLPYFGNIDSENLKEYYRIRADFNGREISIDLNFNADSIDEKGFNLMKRLLESIESFDRRNKEYIIRNYTEEVGAVRFYVQFHLDEEEMGADELFGIVDFSNEIESPEIQLVKALQLKRLGLYPHNSAKQFAIFDYSIGDEISQYLVVILTDENGNINEITVES